MSWSLQLQNGDLALSGASLATVTDTNKLTQDLRCALVEHMGDDDMHPTYGSLIDGGVTPSGQVIPSVIGMTDVQEVATTIQSEIQRIAAAYQAQQLNRAKDDQVTYNRVSLTPAEVLLSVSDISFIQETDSLLVTITLSTAAGEDITVALPILTNS